MLPAQHAQKPLAQWCRRRRAPETSDRFCLHFASETFVSLPAAEFNKRFTKVFSCYTKISLDIVVAQMLYFVCTLSFAALFRLNGEERDKETK